MDPREIFRNLPEVETERLLLRKLSPDDAEAMFAFASDPVVARFTSWEPYAEKLSAISHQLFWGS